MTASQAVQERPNVAFGLVSGLVGAQSAYGDDRPGSSGSHFSVFEHPAAVSASQLPFAYHSSPLMPTVVAQSDASASSRRYESPALAPTRPSSGSGGVKSEDDDASYVAGPGSSKKKGKDGPKRTGKLPNATTATLKDWLMLHVHHPYPTEYVSNFSQWRLR